MSRIVRYEFMGNWFYFWVLCISGVGIPAAILCLVNGTLRIEHEVDDPEQFVTEYRARNDRS